MFMEALNELLISNKGEAEILLKQFRKQRDFFFSKRIAELNTIYSLTEKEEKTLQATKDIACAMTHSLLSESSRQIPCTCLPESAR